MTAPAENIKTRSELSWIEEKGSWRPPSDEFQLIGQSRKKNRDTLEKLADYFLIPGGLIATTACLVLGLRSMVKGSSAQQQIFMRGRVGFQAMTFVIIGSCMWYTSTKRQREESAELEKK